MPRNGAGSIATVAAASPRPAMICASRPPNEWPITTGFLSSRRTIPSTWSAIWPTLLCANTSGCAFASSTVSGSSGQPGLSAAKPASSNIVIHRSQLDGSSQSPCTNATGVRPDAFARSTCSASWSLIVPVSGAMLAITGPPSYVAWPRLIIAVPSRATEA